MVFEMQVRDSFAEEMQKCSTFPRIYVIILAIAGLLIAAGLVIMMLRRRDKDA